MEKLTQSETNRWDPEQISWDGVFSKCFPGLGGALGDELAAQEARAGCTHEPVPKAWK